MLWVIQNNLYNEVGYVRFIEALDRLGSNYTIVKPIPFTNILLPADFDSATQNVEDVEEPKINTSQKIIAMGATSLTRIARAKGWHPGTFNNENFHFPKWRDGFGNENILSSDATVGKVKDLVGCNRGDWNFVRPTLDTKAFSGTVMSRHDLHDWILQIGNIPEEEFAPLHKNTEILIASAKKIYSECRIFVVNNKVVTASMYKQGSRVIANSNVDNRFIMFAYGMIGRWQDKVDIRLVPEIRVPADAFVIDVADTPEGLKVIEINTINSSGFYDADVQKIIMALEDLVR